MWWGNDELINTVWFDNPRVSVTRDVWQKLHRIDCEILGMKRLTHWHWKMSEKPEVNFKI